jgi:hypothetical protein
MVNRRKGGRMTVVSTGQCLAARAEAALEGVTERISAVERGQDHCEHCACASSFEQKFALMLPNDPVGHE